MQYQGVTTNDHYAGTGEHRGSKGTNKQKSPYLSVQVPYTQKSNVKGYSQQDQQSMNIISREINFMEQADKTFKVAEAI